MYALFPVLGGVAVVAAIVLARWIYALSWRGHLTAYRLELPRDLTQDQVSNWLAALGAATRRIPAAIEITATDSGITHHLVMPQFHARMLLGQVRAQLPGIRAELDPVADVAAVRAAGELRVTSTSHPLGQERAAIAAGTLLGALHPLGRGQMIRVSWLVAGTTPSHPARLSQLAPDLARFHRAKQRFPLLRVCGRVTVSGTPPQIARALLYRVYSTLRVLDAPGAALVRRMLPWRVVAQRVRDRSLPITVWPALLNTRELAGLVGFPLDGAAVPGITIGTARQLPPSADFPRTGVVLAHSNYPSLTNRPLALRQADRLRHLWLLGPTGTGKSTLIATMAIQDARAGYGLVVVDPKSDLCNRYWPACPRSG